jgi:hypothetical protein
MNCSKCGGILHHLVTDTNGKTYYQCTTGLTSIRMDGSIAPVKSCGLVHDSHGQIFDGYISYHTNEKTEHIRVVKGIIQ